MGHPLQTPGARGQTRYCKGCSICMHVLSQAQGISRSKFTAQEKQSLGVKNILGPTPFSGGKIDLEWRTPPPPTPPPSGIQGDFRAKTKENPNRTLHFLTETGTFRGLSISVWKKISCGLWRIFNPIAAVHGAQRTLSKRLCKPGRVGIVSF